MALNQQDAMSALFVKMMKIKCLVKIARVQLFLEQKNIRIAHIISNGLKIKNNT